MIKVTGYNPIKPASNVRKRGASSSVSSFSDILDASGADDTAPALQTADVAQTASVANMLALQELSGEEVNRKKLAQQGKSMLDVLESLRRQLLIGAIPAHMMHDLDRQLAQQKHTVSDPALIDIIEEIELRVAVELAKLQKAADTHHD